jgi:phosphoribosylaminoimidazolecarboxamide formyltransferase/IMP cyclohydrolase
MSRVDSVRIAIDKCREAFGDDAAGLLKDSAVASDAFYPFPDGPQTAMDAGATALVQPGGSKRDNEVVSACDESGAAMVFTGRRHFRH